MARGIRSRSALTVLAVCVTVLGADAVLGGASVPRAAAAPAQQPAQAPQSAPAQGCITMKGMTEGIIDGSVQDLGGPYPESIGGSSTYLDYLYDSSGKKVATVYGKANVSLRLKNGDLAEYSDEQIEFADGVIQTQGFYDITAAAKKGTWEYLPAIGVSGRYQGMVGQRHFEITQLGKSLNGWIQLCLPGATAPQ
ncbi:hypothetical protein [Streptacidiphilus sp. P02-A3a]|uniref:allene oxide cyclase barrel-like domain-containing protein n=1 Tax=Streptacidiphilus sp. P02-A3a TaxID=2704468 RepID=UPI0015FB3EEA|nr:hypothetical protein [Streptacidiphilus sp. P02-A3a]QMU71580.1 hypothetical protein GXP74_28440 [Streptacidiphilus sp. P02-A3a]